MGATSSYTILLLFLLLFLLPLVFILFIFQFNILVGQFDGSSQLVRRGCVVVDRSGLFQWRCE